jgi:hypothetical protein
MIDINQVLSPFRTAVLGDDTHIVYFMRSGGDLEPYRQILLPFLLPLWASALSRTVDDDLVIEDAGKYPFGLFNRVYLVVTGSEISAIYLHKVKYYEAIPVLGVGICLVGENYQRQGLISRLIERSIADIHPMYLTFHTQNQHMVQTGRKFCPKGSLFSIDQPIPSYIYEMGVVFAHKSDRYDVDHMIERGFYAEGNPLYGDRRPRESNAEDVRSYFHDHVNFDNGDSLLVIGSLHT